MKTRRVTCIGQNLCLLYSCESFLTAAKTPRNPLIWLSLSFLICTMEVTPQISHYMRITGWRPYILQMYTVHLHALPLGYRRKSFCCFQTCALPSLVSRSAFSQESPFLPEGAAYHGNYYLIPVAYFQLPCVLHTGWLSIVACDSAVGSSCWHHWPGSRRQAILQSTWAVARRACSAALPIASTQN